MATKPTVIRKWADQLLNNGPLGGPNREEPSALKQDEGYAYAEKPSFESINGILNALYQWSKWAEDSIDELGGGGSGSSAPVAAYVRFSATGGSITIIDSSGVGSVTRQAKGKYQVNFESEVFNNENYYISATAGIDSTSNAPRIVGLYQANTASVNQCSLLVSGTGDGAFQDADDIRVIFFGGQ